MDVLVRPAGPRPPRVAGPAPRHARAARTPVRPVLRATAALLAAGLLSTGVLVGVSALVARWG